MKVVRKILLYLLLVTAVALISLVASVFLFKEQIIKQFIAAANENLSTPVKVGHISVSAFSNFPRLSIVLTDVYVEDSHKGLYPLLTAKRISFQLNPIEVYRGNYTISGLEVADSETNLKINTEGELNYVVLKSDQESKGTTIGFELKNIQLKNTVVHYSDQTISQDFDFLSDQLTASIKNTASVYRILAQGDVTTQQIEIGRHSLLEGKRFITQANLVYDDEHKKLTIEPSSLGLRSSEFLVKGNYQWKKNSIIDLLVEGKKTNLQTLLSLLPEKTAAAFDKYESDGSAYFSAALKGGFSDTEKLPLSVQFGLRDVTITHPDTKSKIMNVQLEGSFATSDVVKYDQAVLVLKNVQGSLNNEPFEAELVVKDFTDPSVIFKFKGRIDAKSFQSFYPINGVLDPTGNLQMDISFEGKPSWLKSKATAQQATTSGSLELQNLSFMYGEEKRSVKNLVGTLQFNNHDLAISNVSVTFGNSDFLVNGFFKNVVNFVLFENQPIGIEADLKSNYLDVDELFAVGYSSAEDSEGDEYSFGIPSYINLNFDCEVGQLRYKRFHAGSLTGNLLVKNKVAAFRNIKLKTMGGKVELSGIVDAVNTKAIDVMTSAKLTSIYLDSVFYVFNNFDQNFIEDKHLRGQVNADVMVDLTLNEKLRLFPETLVADISAVVKNGELNQFGPLQTLNKYLDDEGLHSLRFAELKNDIHIENKTVYIPQMEVRSNVTPLVISGTHTFDQQIDYHIVTPFRNKGKIDITEARTAMEEMNGQMKLFLKITGTTDNYRVQYDTEAAKKKIAGDLKKEVQELKDAFKGKDKKKQKEIELSTEEFDWDN